jgi:uncharacterized protein with PQ loop repeat
MRHISFECFYEKYILIAGAAGHLASVFQTIKIINVGSSQNVCLSGYLICLASLISWFVYGIIKRDRALILVNAFGCLAVLTCIGTILAFS